MTHIDPVTFKITHTRGTAFDKTIPVNYSGSAINWASQGYVSGTCYVKKNLTDENPAFALTVDISVNGALRLYADAIISDVGNYFYDIKLLKTGSKPETWWKEEPCEFELTQNIT